MSELQINAIESGYQLIGHLTFDNVNEVVQSTPDFSNLDEVISIDVSQLEHVDSAGLSALLHWNRAAQELNKSLTLVNASEQLSTLIEVTGLSAVLG